MLAKGEDAKLKGAASADIGAVEDAEKQFVAAGEWSDLGEASSGIIKAGMRERAAYWYGVAGPNLSGLNRVLAEKRVAEAGPGAVAAARPAAKPFSALGIWVKANTGTQFNFAADGPITRLIKGGDMRYAWGSGRLRGRQC